MPVTATPIFPQAINTGVLVFNNSGTSPTTAYTTGANGSKIENILVTNTDTNAYTVNIFFTQGATNYLVGTVNIPASTGDTISASTINLLNDPSGNFSFGLDVDANGNNYFYLSSTTTLKLATTGTVTSGKNLTFVTTGGDF